MTIELRYSTDIPDDCDALVVGVNEGLRGTDIDLDRRFCADRGFDGSTHQMVILPGPDGRQVIALGLGKPGDVTLSDLRKASAAATRHLGKAKHPAYDLLGAIGKSADPKAALQAIAEGVGLGSYRFERYRSEPKPQDVVEATVIGRSASQATGVERAATVVNSVCLARDLVNGSPDDVTPSYLAEVAEAIAKENKLRLRVWGPDEIEKQGLGGLRGVSLGSDEPARYIELTYKPRGKKSNGRLVVVGKGITFDSGGLSLKPSEGMMTMKYDMSGAAAVLGLMSSIAEIAPACEVVGIICATENLPGPHAQMPGDVLTARNGKTIEVLNTDAEGRLVLADGLSMAVELGADAIVDLATLTGACLIALGEDYAGRMTNSDAFAAQLEAAASRAGELTWPLPLPQKYRKLFDSEVADMKNIGNGREAGTIVAGLFLKEFVGDVPWVHLDIAGPAYSKVAAADLSKGGTGFGVRTLIELVTGFKRPAGSRPRKAKTGSPTTRKASVRKTTTRRKAATRRSTVRRAAPRKTSAPRSTTKRTTKAGTTKRSARRR